MSICWRISGTWHQNGFRQTISWMFSIPTRCQGWRLSHCIYLWPLTVINLIISWYTKLSSSSSYYIYICVTLLVRAMIITVSWAITAWSILTHTLSNRTIITVRLKSSHCWSTINYLSPLQPSRAMLHFNQANKVFHCPLFPWLAYLPSSKLT